MMNLTESAIKGHALGMLVNENGGLRACGFGTDGRDGLPPIEDVISWKNSTPELRARFNEITDGLVLEA